MSLSNTHSLGCLYVHGPYPAQYSASSTTAATAATFIYIYIYLQIQAVATCAQQTQQQLDISNKTLSASLDEMRMKYMKTRTTLLAVKGRNSMDMKRQHRAEEEEERR